MKHDVEPEREDSLSRAARTLLKHAGARPEDVEAAIDSPHLFATIRDRIDAGKGRRASFLDWFFVAPPVWRQALPLVSVLALVSVGSLWVSTTRTVEAPNPNRILTVELDTPLLIDSPGQVCSISTGDECGMTPDQVAAAVMGREIRSEP